MGCLLAASFTTACVDAVVADPDSPPVGRVAEAITNGTDDDVDSGVVALLVKDQVLCTGFLLTSQIVVTAAHCVDQIVPDRVYFGENPHSKTGTFIAVADTQTHPDFDPATLVSDIGIVALATPAPTTPVSVMETFESSFVGMPLRLVGFGAKQGGDVALSKHVGTTTIESVASQSFRFKGAPSQTCEGDSGGPAFVTIDGHESVVGITSSGDTDCKSFGNDTRLDVFVPWLTNYVKAYKAPVNYGPIASGGCSLNPTSKSRPGMGWLAFGCALAALGRRRRVSPQSIRQSTPSQ
jgi:secreted trypsin-like serine protease